MLLDSRLYVSDKTRTVHFLILLYYIIFTNFYLFVRAKVSNLSLLKYFGKCHAINATLPYVDESNF